jgi:hypothetical protein
MKRRLPLLAACALVLAPALAGADNTKRTAEAAAKTAADAVVDGGRTIGRSTKALVTDGTDKAKATWKENARVTSDDAKANSRATRAVHDGK